MVDINHKSNFCEEQNIYKNFSLLCATVEHWQKGIVTICLYGVVKFDSEIINNN